MSLHRSFSVSFRRGTLAISLFALLTGCGDNPSEVVSQVAPEMAVYKVAPEDVALSAEFVGQTKGAVDADVRARVEGVLLAMHFREGTHVKEGDLLYNIDPEPFQAKVNEAKAKLAEAETKLVKANSDLNRVRPLAEMGAVSQRDLDSAVAAEGVAIGGVDAAKANLESTMIELGYCNILAPVGGLIGLTKARVGEFVGRPPNAVVLNTVSQLDPIHVRFTVTEKDYLYFARLRQKQEQDGGAAEARVLELVLTDGSIHSEIGKVVSIDSQIDASTGSLTAEAAFPNPGLILRPGQFAKVRTVKETLKSAFLIPKKSVRELQGLMQVGIVSPDQTFALRTVTLGAEIGGSVVVTDGLQADDLVTVDPQTRIKGGSKVTPKIVERSK